MIPLEDVILYNNNSYPNKFWNFERNTTEWSVFMNELTSSGNALSKLMLQVKAIALPDTHIGPSKSPPSHMGGFMTEIVFDRLLRFAWSLH